MNEQYRLLKELAFDLRWSWNHSADKVWAALDPELWELTHNPWVILQTISRAKFEQSLSDPNFRNKVDSLIDDVSVWAKARTWFEDSHPKTLGCVAYFSMEFMLSEALPIYSGGLGNVAGDQLKAASDLGVPVVGVGLLYSQGYFRQIIDKFGNQQAIYPYNDPFQLPIAPLRKPDGEWLRLNLEFPGWSVWVRAWEVKVGRARLYLLDTNDAANFPVHRGITSELYGGDKELRLKQELILGIAGWRLLKDLGLSPDVCHLNEGHAAFAILERAHSFMQENNLPFETAMAATRPGNVFTTHTAVSAGFDLYPPALMKAYLGKYAEAHLKIPFEDLLKLGQENHGGAEELFNMAHLAVRGSGAVNGVSKIHGKVSRRLFQPLFHRWPEEEVPVGSVTNGVHMPSWDSLWADGLWTKYCGKYRWLGETEELGDKIRKVPDKEIWKMREQSRQALVEFARNRLAMQLQARGGCQEEVDSAKSYLSPGVLTIGFARRFASYKRPNLLLSNPDRLLRILSNPKYPAQIILAGKAHPADQEGQSLIRKWMEFIFQNAKVRSRVIFLSDYDMLLTEQMVQGTDLWINTPRRPWEACGTSGMKILVNGGLNLSELDGWWAEGYHPEVGWAIGDEVDRGEDPGWDAREADALYDLLEQKIIPQFYQRNEEGIPAAWVAKIRESMARLTPRFSANRAVREYTELYYIPASQHYRKRTANASALAQEIAAWKRFIISNWEAVGFGKVKIEGQTYEVEVLLGQLKPENVRVELFGGGPSLFMQEMRPAGRIANGYIYRAVVSEKSNLAFFTPRITPFHPEVSTPLEMSGIKWQK